MGSPFFTEEALMSLATLLNQLSGIPLSFRIHENGMAAVFRSKKCELSLKSDGNGSVMIDRIEVPCPCKGYGSQILDEITHLSGVSRIVIRNTSTLDAIRFCRRHGFHPIICSCKIMDGELYGNYELLLNEPPEASLH